MHAELKSLTFISSFDLENIFALFLPHYQFKDLLLAEYFTVQI